MKAFYFNEKGEFVPYENGEKPTEPFWFLYYFDEILLTLSIDTFSLGHKIDDIDMHHHAVAAKLTTKKAPACAGIFSPERRIFDSWFSIWTGGDSPQAFRQPVIDFFTNELKIL